MAFSLNKMCSSSWWPPVFHLSLIIHIEMSHPELFGPLHGMSELVKGEVMSAPEGPWRSTLSAQTAFTTSCFVRELFQKWEHIASCFNCMLHAGHLNHSVHSSPVRVNGYFSFFNCNINDTLLFFFFLKGSFYLHLLRNDIQDILKGIASGCPAS